MDEAAIKQVVAGFSDGWSHDAHAMCVSLVDDVQWVNWRGEVVHSRKEVEDQHATLFAGRYYLSAFDPASVREVIISRKCALETDLRQIALRSGRVSQHIGLQLYVNRPTN